jgi:hypothetical protein
MALLDDIDQEINNLVPQMIEDALTSQTHNGADSQQIYGGNLVSAPQPAVTAPSGGTYADTQARQAINDIISRLQALGLTN